MQRGVTGYDRTGRADMCTRELLSRESSMCPPRRGVYALHLMFLFQLSPKVGMNWFLSHTWARFFGSPYVTICTDGKILWQRGPRGYFRAI